MGLILEGQHPPVLESLGPETALWLYSSERSLPGLGLLKRHQIAHIHIRQLSVEVKQNCSSAR
jgi:hypothetical protein